MRHFVLNGDAQIVFAENIVKALGLEERRVLRIVVDVHHEYTNIFIEERGDASLLDVNWSLFQNAIEDIKHD